MRWSKEYSSGFALLPASHTLCAPSDWGIVALLTLEQVYKLNLLEGEKAGNSREQVNSQLLIIIDWLLTNGLVVCLNSWEWGVFFLLSSLQTNNLFCSHFLRGGLGGRCTEETREGVPF